MLYADKAALEASFHECLDTEENRAKRAEALRFKIGEVRGWLFRGSLAAPAMLARSSSLFR